MQRISTPSAVQNLFGPGKHGFTDGDPVGGIPTTWLEASFFNAVQEEIATVVEGAGIALDAARRDQLLTAIRRITRGIGRVDMPVDGWQSAPPVAPAADQLYVVKAPGSGAWAGRDHQLAVYLDGAWGFVAPTPGLIANIWTGAREIILYFTGAAWIDKAVIERAQGLNYRAAAQATADALAITLDPAPANLAELIGAPLRVRIATTNTGPATLNVNGLGARPIVRIGTGAALAAKDMMAGGIYSLTYDGTSFQVSTSGGVVLQSGDSSAAAPKLLNIDATMTSNVTIANAVNTLLQFQTTNNSNLGTSTWNGSRLTVGAGEAGLWYVQASWTFATPTTGIFSTCRIRRNGSAVLGEAAPPYVENGGGVVIQTQTIMKLAEGDYVEAVAAQQAGSAQPASADPRSRFVAMLLSSF